MRDANYLGPNALLFDFYCLKLMFVVCNRNNTRLVWYGLNVLVHLLALDSGFVESEGRGVTHLSRPDTPTSPSIRTSDFLLSYLIL